MSARLIDGEHALGGDLKELAAHGEQGVSTALQLLAQELDEAIDADGNRRRQRFAEESRL